MDERVDSLDLEWFRPPASELIGLRIASDEEFRRCEVVLGEHLEIFRWVNKWDRFVVVRKTDLHLFHEAGLNCTEVELSEPSEDQTEEQRAETRAAMKRYMDLWLKELGWRK